MQLATESRPRFRTDLVAECIEAEGQRFIDVIDPDTGDAFRFYEVEYSLACAMDGERDVVGLVQWAKEELGIEPSRAELETVITTLGDLGYLDQGVPAVAVARGVVAPAAAAVPRGMDVELGLPGGAPPVAYTPIPHEDVELGMAGGTPAARVSIPTEDVELGMAGGAGSIDPMPSLRRGATRPDADEDGPTHLPPADTGDFDDEVSVDLSEHLSLKPDDVKEAVRMSRSMKAVEVPPEMLEEIGQKEADAARRTEAARIAARADVEAPPLARPQPVPELELPPPSPMLQMQAEPAPRAPVELPEKPVVVSRRQPGGDRTPVPRPMPPPSVPALSTEPAPPVEKRGVSGLLIFVFVLVVLGGAAFLVWKYVLNTSSTSSDDDTSSTSKEPKKPPKPPVGSGTATGSASAAGTASGTAVGTGTASGTGSASTGSAAGTGTASASSAGTGTASASGAGTSSASGAGTASSSAPVQPASATLQGGAGTVDVPAGTGGTVMTIVAAGTTVAEGDLIAEYAGGAAMKGALAKSGLAYDVETRYPREIKDAQAKLDAATAANNAGAAKAAKAKVDERTGRLEEQKKKLDAIQAQLASFTVVSPAAGKVVAPVKRGSNVASGGVVAKIDTGGAGLTAVFDLTGQQAQNWAVGVAVPVTVKDKPDQHLKCSVAAVDGPKLTVSCPTDGGAESGTVVLLK